MSNVEMSEIDHTIFKTFEISREEFLSLPREYQRAFLFCDWQLSNNQDIKTNHNNEKNEEVKKKILKYLGNK